MTDTRAKTTDAYRIEIGEPSSEEHDFTVGRGEIGDECERLGCTNGHTERVRFEGDTTTRRLCRPCKKEHLKVSS